MNMHYDQFKNVLGRPVHFCNECKPVFDEQENFEQYAESLQICDKCLTVCALNVDACHSCGKKFLPFKETMEKILGPNPSFPKKELKYTSN